MHHGCFLVFDLSESVEKTSPKKNAFSLNNVLRCLAGKVIEITTPLPPGLLVFFCRNVSIHACGCFFQGVIHAADSSQRRYVGQLPASTKHMQEWGNGKLVLESVHHGSQWDFNDELKSRSEACFDVTSRDDGKKDSLIYWPSPHENLITFWLLYLRMKNVKMCHDWEVECFSQKKRLWF